MTKEQNISTDPELEVIAAARTAVENAKMMNELAEATKKKADLAAWEATRATEQARDNLRAARKVLSLLEQNRAAALHAQRQALKHQQ